MDKFDYSSRRAREARFSRYADKPLAHIFLVLLTVSLAITGGWLLYQRNSIAWSCFGFAIFFQLLNVWIKTEVRHLPIGKTESINDLLTRECLAGLDRHPTPQKIAEFVDQTQSGYFFARRYAITPRTLSVLASTLSDDPTPIFAKACEIRKKTDSEQISGAVLALAIIECSPKHEDVLRQLKLDLPALYDGVEWFNHLHNLVKSIKASRHTGGFARDLMFGYTPLLQRFAINISRQFESGPKVQLHMAPQREIVEQMIQIFSKGGRQNVALIGPEGSGRTTIVGAFADRILDSDNPISSNLKYRQIFKLDANALIGVAKEKGELETIMTRILNEAFNAKNIILWLDNAQLFFEDSQNSVDISNLLVPILEAGRLRLILTMDQQRFLEISAHNSSLTNALNKIMVEPADEAETMRIMQDHVPMLEYQHNVCYTYWALTESYRLSKRYVHDLVMPGQALNLLESAADFPEKSDYITSTSVQAFIEKTYGVKTQSGQDDATKSKLLNMESLIHERIVGQDAAVKAVSSALRRAAAGVRNENRPIGTFLFLGPTGVGKTELAKAISEVYFNGEKQIARIDLNEYVKADDVARLIADGAENELSLTAQVMKRPFSVVLLDEIEKAHPQVLTTLLQLLDEGVLRDVNNREISFRDTIVIATSNAGADKIRTAIDQGEDLATIKDELTNELITAGDFKPEFLNRFDEICVFEPLNKDSLAQIVDLIIKSVNQTLEPQKISVIVDDEAKQLLVEHGYDPKLGARPMHRIVQKTIENIVAKLVLSNQISAGATVNITAADVKDQLEQD